MKDNRVGKHEFIREQTRICFEGSKDQSKLQGKEQRRMEKQSSITIGKEEWGIKKLI